MVFIKNIILSATVTVGIILFLSAASDEKSPDEKASLGESDLCLGVRAGGVTGCNITATDDCEANRDDNPLVAFDSDIDGGD